MTLTVHCPDPDCTAPAEIVDRWLWNSIDGPIEHVRTRCLARHVFTPTADSLVVDPEPSELMTSRQPRSPRPPSSPSSPLCTWIRIST